jgi:tetratricopeptide (TPR) repeat protein
VNAIRTSLAFFTRLTWWKAIVFCWIVAIGLSRGFGADTDLFTAGIEAYNSGQFTTAAEMFQRSATQEIASGTLQNLGNAQWKQGRIGGAILAWEQALWVNPFDARARNNLRFARDEAQLEAPELAWYEVTSSWLPANWWAWLAGFSFWGAVSALVLPGVMRWRRAAWMHAVAAIGFGLFLLCLPAHLGTVTRARVGFVLNSDTLLRLTPTSTAETVTRLTAGDPVRHLRRRGLYAFVKTRYSQGWLLASEVGWIASDAPAAPLPSAENR